MIFSGLYGRGRVAQEVADRAVVQAMLDAEVALLRALAHCGLAPQAAADELAAVADAASLDLEQVAASTADQGTPVPGLLAALRQRVGPDAAAHLHRGATSQDIVDTAIMLVARRAFGPLLDDVACASMATARLAEEHRDTVAIGRTLMQQALPMAFGLKAAVWLSALTGIQRELEDVRDTVLAVQLGGAVGTLSALGDRGLDVVSEMAAQLQLAEPELPWHTIRLRPARLAGALGAALGAMAKIARDIVLLAQTEVGEAHEAAGDGRGGSSTMPHKQNPVGAIAVLACAQRAPGLVATILGAMPHEHERAAGAWQGEWGPLLELLELTGSAASALQETLAGLELDRDRVQSNLELGGALVMTESVVTALSGSLGRAEAQKLVQAAVQRSAREAIPLTDALLAVPEIAATLAEDGVRRALDPRSYLGVSSQLIDRALAAHRALPDEQSPEAR